MRLNLKYFFATFLIVLITSCANRKKIVYFQGEIPRSDSSKAVSPLLEIDDLLEITVMGLDAEAVRPFNLSTYGSYAGKEVSAGQSQLQGYLIDGKGEIDFPVVGKIKLGGLTRTEAANLLRIRLSDYIKDPILNIRLLNFKITILGDVGRPGTYIIPNERITILEAIGLAGDLNLSGLRKNAVVIRDNAGKITQTRIDLTNNSIFNSPVYYLKQNDVVYIEHNRAKKNAAVVNLSTISVVVSLTSIIVTLATLLSRN